MEFVKNVKVAKRFCHTTTCRRFFTVQKKYGENIGFEKFCSEIGVVERILHYYKGGDDNSGKEIEFIKCKSYKTFLTY